MCPVNVASIEGAWLVCQAGARLAPSDLRPRVGFQSVLEFNAEIPHLDFSVKFPGSN